MDVMRLLAKLWNYKNVRIRNPAVGKCLDELEKNQWLPPGEIKELQWRKVERILRHSYENVPYYRETFDKMGIRVDDIQTPEYFRKIPILTKQIIQDNFDNLKASNFSKYEAIENHTGGSTGEPLTFYQCKDYLNYAAAGRQLAFAMCGYKMGDKVAYVWGSDYDSRNHTGWRRIVMDRLLNNVLFINTFDLSQEKIEQYLDYLVKWKPHYIWGYASSVSLLAKTAIENKIHEISPKAIQTTAEVLTTEQRELIQEAFQCKVFDRYGCREVSIISHECSEHSELHILATNNYVEFLDENEKPVEVGSSGRIIVTNLNNFAMPFIRYEVGDVGRPSNQVCKCGRGLPLMGMVDGRIVDTIVSPSGKFLHGEFFTHLFYKIEGVKQFQVMQEDKENLLVKIVPMKEFNAEKALPFLRDVIHKHGDEKFKINFQICDFIEPSSSGKFRFTISELNK